MLRFVPLVLVIVVQIYALIDCIQTPDEEAKHLPKIAWVILIIIAPLVGAVAWLLAGRPRGADGHGRQGPVPGGDGRPLGPDDDPDFLAQLREVDAEHERMLEQWEEDLRKREQDLRGDETDRPSPPGDDKDRPA